MTLFRQSSPSLLLLLIEFALIARFATASVACFRSGPAVASHVTSKFRRSRVLPSLHYTSSSRGSKGTITDRREALSAFACDQIEGKCRCLRTRGVSYFVPVWNSYKTGILTWRWKSRRKSDVAFLQLRMSANEYLSAESLTSSSDMSQPTTEGSPYQFYEEYWAAMEQVLTSQRVFLNEKPDQIQIVTNYLSIPCRVISVDLPDLLQRIQSHQVQKDKQHSYKEDDAITTSESGPLDLRSQLIVQRATFLQSETIPITTLAQHKLVSRALTYLGDYCAKNRNTKPLYVAWDKIKEAGMIMRENALSTFLFVLSLDKKDDVSSGKRFAAQGFGEKHAWGVEEEVATFHDLLYQPNEKTTTLRVKAMVAKGDAMAAEQLLNLLQEQSESSVFQQNLKYCAKSRDDGRGAGELKLRTYLPILELYCKQGEIGPALTLYQRMRNSRRVIFEAETYAMLLAAIAAQGYFREDSKRLPGAEAIGYIPATGSSFFDTLMMEMSQDVLEISNSCANLIRNGFAVGFRGLDFAMKVKEVPEDCQMSPVHEPARDDELVVCRVKLDCSSAVCPRTNATLRLIQLEAKDKKLMQNTLLQMADTQFETYDAKMEANNQKPKKDGPDVAFAGKELTKFAEWLDKREGRPFTAIVDGPNIAYFGLGRINYYQVQLMVETLEKMDETPLVVMPQKYVQEKFYIRQGYVQSLTKQEMDIITTLSESGKLYTVPQRCLDDYYWMLASVSDQTRSRKGVNLDVLPSRENERFPGLRPMLISNDRMRDHRLELLEPRLFRQWYSSHIVNYSFSVFDKERLKERAIKFTAADFFSREIQGNMSHGSNDSSSGNGIAWHFPVCDWDSGDRFCIRISPARDEDSKS